ncbi:MAG TPA: hypothetical protein VM802_20550 [Chitinophaga sp.]|uniref:hypothetical protein n=1 Tax=Chitinophaga sp. TaxID=1869181 RepID=UPI002BA6DDF2|nr:hypothetical protein [Chitinophaga sp.]HVI47280.1 hypothetical protein [Chitinophaga sp.]
MEKPKRRKIIEWTFIIILVLILGAGWYLNQHWTRLLRREIPGYVSELSDSLYVVKFRDLKLNVLTGSVTLTDASMTPDTAVYHQLLAAHRAPADIYTVHVEKLELNYFRPWRYFIKKEFNAASVVVSSPDILVEQNATVKDTSAPKTAYESISSKMKSIIIGKLILDNTHLKYIYTRKDSTRLIRRFNSLRIRINDFLINAASLNDPTRYLYARNYEIRLRDQMRISHDSLYQLNIKGISYDAAERTLHAGQLEIQPRYDKAAFQQRNGVQQDRYEVLLSNISIENLNPILLLQEQKLWAQRVNINAGKLHIYRDRRLPMPPGNKLGKYPNQLLQQLKLPVKIDTLTGNNIDVQYTEVSPDSGEEGAISFGRVNGRLTNITNIDSMVKINNHCIADVDAVFMQSGKLTAHFDFTLQSPTGSFSVNGQLKDMNGKDLNQVTEPLGKVEIRSCNIRDLNFNISGDEYKASGTVKLLYDNLKIALLQHNNGQKGYIRQGLKSFVANIMVIQDSNPLPGGKIRVSTPAYKRDIQKSFFNLIWKTLFTGVKETVGAKNI